jgi:hypothetical protein
MTASPVEPFWPNHDHWSVEIPLDTPHPRPEAMRERGFVQLRDLDEPIPPDEYLDLEYMDWKSGGDTNFAPIATADGQLDCRGFWNDGDERPDKDAIFTSNADRCPTIRRYVEQVGANFGRVRVIKLEPQDHDTALRSFHRDDNNRFNPDSYMLLMDPGADGLPDPATEIRVPLHQGARFVVDTQRLWHVVVHNGNAPRYALITSFESGPVLDRWITSQLR